MSNIVIVLPKIEDAKGLKNLLVRSGFDSVKCCVTGAQALSLVDELLDGIVISGYRMADMTYDELKECLPKNFDFLLLASKRVLGECDCGEIMSLSMPLKAQDFISTVTMMDEAVMRRHRRLKQKARERDLRQQAVVLEAKKLLMERNHMTEEEAHRYIQKCSMDSGNNMVETAKMVLALMEG